MNKVKPIPSELKSKFCKHLCEKIANDLELDATYNVNSGIHNFIYFSNNTHSSEVILKTINKEIAGELIKFIETETHENAQEYDRSITLFESTSTEVNLTITW